ncbi:MAG TPA: diguanylate cyclase [Acidimicrobiales bacterium]|nr:diguanylate cyclase [Acidimicrobiales bacterium]
MSLARRLISVTDEQELLRLVCLTARERLGYTACALALRGDDGNFRFVSMSGLTPEQELTLRGRRMSMSAFEALSHAAMQSGQVYLVPPGHPVRQREDVRAGIIETGVSVPSRSWRQGSMLFVPLIGSDGQPVGFINPDDPLSGELPTSEHVTVLEALAELTVVGLELVRARATERSSIAVVEAQRRQLEALMTASAQVRGGLVLDDVLHEIAIAMTSAGGFNRAAVYLLRDDDVLECRATVGLSAAEDEELRSSTISLAEFAPAMLPQMQISRSYLFDHRRFVLPAELDAKLNVPAVDRECKEGEWHPEDMLTVPLVDKDGSMLGVISLDESSNGLLPDRAHIEALEFFADQCATAILHARRFEVVRVEALTDPLTGLANRRALEDVIEASVNRYQRFGEPATLLFIDIDHFKDVNDSFGHAVGDGVLQRVGAALRERLRRGDLIARYGGEEFVALLPDSTIESGSALAESLRKRIEALDLHDVCGDLPIRVSIGVAGIGPGLLDAASLLAAADAAMYRAKREGRNRVSVAEAPA